MKNFSLFPHQIEAAKFLRRARYAILGDGMGLGKTLSALAAAGDEEKVIILCPASLKQVWALELTSKYPKRPFAIFDPKKKISRFLDKVTIINYEQIEKAAHLFKDAVTVIVDEAHYLKTPKSQRTKLFKGILKKTPPKNLYLLTGTPIKNTVPEIWTLLMFCSAIPGERVNGVDVREEYPSQGRFCEAMCYVRTKRVAGMMLQEWYGVKDPLLLHRLLKGKYLARRRDDVVKLPPLTEIFAPVAKLTRDLELRDAFKKYQEKRDIPSPIKVQTAVEKVQFTVPFVENLLETEDSPIVVFTDHREPARLLYETLGRKYVVGLITGDVSIDKRNVLIDKFQNGDIDVLVCTIGAAGVGVTLTAATTTVYNDLCWTVSDLQQSKCRFYRIGQTHPCKIYFITAPGFDRQILETLNKKANTIEQALGSPEFTKREEISV